MKSRRIAIVVVLLIVAVLAVLFVLRFATRQSSEAPPSIDEIQAAEGVPVDVRVIRRGAVERHLELLGTVEGIGQVNISSSLAIDIKGIAKRAGDPVKKGEVIIELARDRAGRAYHQFEAAKESLEIAENDLRRMENLHEEGAVSGQALEQARLAYRNAKSQYDQASSVVDLVSPIDGVVTMINATVGSMAEPGVPLATVASIDRMRVRCHVGHTEVVQLAVGQRASIQTASRREAGSRDAVTAEGEITRVSLSPDPATKLFLVEITVDNHDGTLRPGVVATVLIRTDERTDVVLAPLDAVIERRGEWYVYRIDSGTAVLTKIEIGTADSDDVEVVDGVAEGDTVVTRGQYQLTDRARVRIQSIEGMD
ncbi:MAG: efflux RND transporter periplasmic adaptor subunit [Candidatus Latescibacterota bacterium]|nr:MAG: efflux RND transporter periplasmic adaptor subunit [Candidatus Latescibacterota bacterium]